MKKRVVFSVKDMAGARAAMDGARAMGVADGDLAVRVAVSVLSDQRWLGGG